MKYLLPIFALGLVLGVVVIQNTERQAYIPVHEIAEREATSSTDIHAEMIDSMTLEEKIGQLFIVGHWDAVSATHTATLIHNSHIGGVIIMDSPQNPSTISQWTSQWQSTSTYPLTIGIDQEGGSVTRLQSPDYTQRAQPDITSSQEAFTIGKQRADELTTLGINTNFAPVLETSTNTKAFLYNRVFRNPTDIVDFGSAMIRGMREAGITAVPKHFPGHEDTPTDSHTELPILTIEANAFDAYVQYFTDTIHEVSPLALMTAHVQVPSIDATYPATLSYTILTEKLRESIGFQGVIITDDMTMQAITDTWSSSEASLLAIQAGADLILHAAKPEDATTAIQTILEAVQSGTLSEERIDESLNRIFTMKESYQ